MKKADVLELVEKLAGEETVDVDRLISTLAFRLEVERGIAAADAGDEIPLDQFEALSEQWLA